MKKIRRQGSQGVAHGYLNLKVEATNCRLWHFDRIATLLLEVQT
jgi:hypothetical protein